MTSPTYSQTSTHTPKPSDKINRNTPLALPAPCFVSDENLCGPAPDRPASGAAVERVLQASCAWCGTAIEVKPRGRRPRFCSQACRQRDYELRTAAARYGADVAAGRIHQEPAERVIERTVLAKHPTRPADWEAALAELAAQVFAPTYALGVAPPGAARFCVLVSVAALRRSALPTVRCRTGSARGGWMTGYRCQDCGREFGVSRGWIDPVALARPPGRRPHPPTRCARWSPSVLAFLAVRRDFFSFRHSSTVRAISRTEAVPEGTPLLPAPAPAAEWEQRHEVLRVISQLPPRQRQVMAWTFDGYTPAEIAEILRLAPDAVRQSLAKARRALADHLRTASKGGHQ